MGARIRAFDWTRTPLGPPEQWPHGLKTAVRIMLTSRQAMWIGWGAELTYLYNDPYKSIIGGKHPQALGQPTETVWREIWAEIGPMLATALQGDQGTYVEAELLIMERNGYPEETYYTFSYSPIPNDSGGTGGIICANTDDTERVIRERQLALLQQLAAAAPSRTPSPTPARAAPAALRSNPRDIPFALLYLRAADRQTMQLAARPRGSRRTIAARRRRCGCPMPASGRWPAPSRPMTWWSSTRRAHATLPAGAWDRRRRRRSPCPWRIAARITPPAVLMLGLNPYRLVRRGLSRLRAGDRRAGRGGAGQRPGLRGGAAPGRGAGRARSGEDRVLLECQPRVPDAADADARPARRSARERARPGRCGSRRRWSIATRCGCCASSTRCSTSRESRPAAPRRHTSRPISQSSRRIWRASSARRWSGPV